MEPRPAVGPDVDVRPVEHHVEGYLKLEQDLVYGEDVHDANARQVGLTQRLVQLRVEGLVFRVWV